VAKLAADVVRYFHQVGADEAGTLGRLRVLREEVISPLVVVVKGARVDGET